MKHKRDQEGYLLIDHRASPGVTAEFIRSCGKDPRDFLVVGEGQIGEAATLTCAHCQKVTIKSPTRQRPRGYCPKCDRYVCDACETQRKITFECCVMEKQIADAQERAFRLSLR